MGKTTKCSNHKMKIHLKGRSKSNIIPVTASECSQPKAAILIVTPVKDSTLLGTATTFAASVQQSFEISP